MTDHQTLAAALAAFQAEMPTVHKGKTAKVPMKAGGSYSYKYADLADIAQAVHPVLAKHGLAFTTLPQTTESGYVLVAKLLHSSGETVEGSLPLQGRTPQEWGSSLTYMRRYLLGCLTGVVTDDDDDGQAASRSQTAGADLARQQAKRETRQQAGRPAPQDTGEAITSKSRATLFAMLGDAPGIGQDETMHKAFLADTIPGRLPDESRSTLTEAQAQVAISRLRAWQNGDEKAAWTPFEVAP